MPVRSQLHITPKGVSIAGDTVTINIQPLRGCPALRAEQGLEF